MRQDGNITMAYEELHGETHVARYELATENSTEATLQDLPYGLALPESMRPGAYTQPFDLLSFTSPKWISLLERSTTHRINLALLPTEEFHETPQESSTAKREGRDDLYSKIAELLEQAKDEHFDEGMASEFSRKLAALIEHYGNDAVIELKLHIFSLQTDDDVAREALCCLGEMDHPESRYFRRCLLELALDHPSIVVRDGAIIGLEDLDDPQAIPALQKAIQREPYKELRDSMKYVISQLGTAD